VLAAEFVPLDVWLRGGTAVPAAPEGLAPTASVAADPEPARDPAASPEAAAATAALLGDLRRFRARLADALDAAGATLIRELAYAVLGRELLLAPADVATLARRILAEHPAARPLEIRHAPDEAPGIDLPCVADPALASGDLIVRFADGCVDAQIGVRLAAVLEPWT
jgi:hypothetical protein